MLWRKERSGNFSLTKYAIILTEAAIIAIAAVAFQPSLSNGFVNWDDHEYVIENPWIHEWSGENLRAIWTQSRGANYHPLVFMTHLIEHGCWQLRPEGYHAVNLFLHILTSLLALRFLTELNCNIYVAGLTAMLFAAHPIHVESVAWIAERKDVLSAAFFMLALCVYVRSVKANPNAFSWRAFALYILALLSKPMAVTWPVVTVLCDLHIGRRKGLRWCCEKALMFVPALAMVVITCLIQTAKLGIRPEMAGQFRNNLQTACRASVFYWGKLLAPESLSAFYPATQWTYPLPLWAAISAGVVMLAAATLWAWRRRAKVFLFALAWYAVTLLPVSGIVPIGFVFAADRYMYLPSVGALLLCSHAVFFAVARWKRFMIVLIPVLALEIAMLAHLTRLRCRVWRNAETLWSDTVKKAPNHYTFRMLGMAQMDDGKLLDAELNMRRGIDDSETQWGRFYLAEILRLQGRHEEAIVWYRRFLDNQDWYVPALSGYGLSLMELRQPAEAAVVFARCAQLAPDTTVHKTHLAWSLMEQGCSDEAELLYLAALEREPSDVLAHYNYGVLLMRQERLREAEFHYRRALDKEPDHNYALVNLGLTLRKLGRPAAAERFLRRALELYPADQIARDEIQAITAQPVYSEF